MTIFCFHDNSVLHVSQEEEPKGKCCRILLNTCRRTCLSCLYSDLHGDPRGSDQMSPELLWQLSKSTCSLNSQSLLNGRLFLQLTIILEV